MTFFSQITLFPLLFSNPTPFCFFFLSSTVSNFFRQITLFPLLNIYKIVVNLNIYKIEIEKSLKFKN